jgi:hypothetical protein
MVKAKLLSALVGGTEFEARFAFSCGCPFCQTSEIVPPTKPEELTVALFNQGFEGFAVSLSSKKAIRHL